MKFENQYLTYEEYTKLEGKLQQMPFNLLEYKAEKEVDKITSNRFRSLKDFPVELKLCINDLIREYQAYNEVGTKSSESLGNYSVSYNKPITTEEQKILTNIIKTYLSETKVNDINVLYCGVDTYEN